LVSIKVNRFYLSKIAGEIPGSAKLVSTTRRLSRFLDNPAVNVREWYQPIAQKWLQAQWQCLGEIRLIVDGTKVGFWTSVAHGQSSVSEAGDPNCLPAPVPQVQVDLGQPCARTQQCAQTIGLIELCENSFTSW